MLRRNKSINKASLLRIFIITNMYVLNSFILLSVGQAMVSVFIGVVCNVVFRCLLA